MHTELAHESINKSLPIRPYKQSNGV